MQLPEGGTHALHGERVYLNLDTRAVIPDVTGLRQFAPLIQAGALELDRVSEHPNVLGEAYFGLECA